jgi:hypothetical protein
MSRTSLTVACGLLLFGCKASDAPPDSAPAEGELVVHQPLEGPSIDLRVPTAFHSYEATVAEIEVAGVADPSAVAVAWSGPGGSGAAEGTSAWSATVPLEHGLQDLVFTATDEQGEQGDTLLRVLYQDDIHFGQPPRLEQRVVLPYDGVDVSIPVQTDGQVEGPELVFQCEDHEGWSVSLIEHEAGLEASFTAPGEAVRCSAWVELSLDGEARRSLATPFSVVEPLADGRAAQVLAQLDDMGDVLAQHPEDWEAGVQAVLEALEAGGYAREAGYSDQGIWWITTDGFLLQLAVMLEGADAGWDAPGPPPPPPPVPSGAPDPILNLYQFVDNGPTFYEGVGSVIAAGGECVDLGIELREGEDFDINSVLAMASGINQLATHGQLISPSTCADAVDQDAYPWWWQCGDGEGAVGFALDVTPTEAIIEDWYADFAAFNLTLVDFRLKHTEDGLLYVPISDPHSRMLVLPGLFDDHMGSDDLDRAVVMLGSCWSMSDHSLAQVLTSKGASAVIGFTDIVQRAYSLSFYGAMWSAWLEGASLQESFVAAFAALDQQDDDAWFTEWAGYPPPGSPDTPSVPELYGDGEVILGGLLTDGSFEDGGFWQLGGDASMVSSFNGHTPTDGSQMLDLSTDWDSGYSYGEARGELCGTVLPAGTYRFSFDWKVVTHADNTQCSSAENPWFIAWIEAYDPVRPDPLDLDVGRKAWCDDVQPDGGFQATDWYHAELSVSVPDLTAPYVGFKAGNAVNREHHVLVDAVEVVRVE